MPDRGLSIVFCWSVYDSLVTLYDLYPLIHSATSNISSLSCPIHRYDFLTKNLAQQAFYLPIYVIAAKETRRMLVHQF